MSGTLAFTLTAASLAAVVGGIISVISILIPSFNVWFAGQTPEFKRMVMSLLGLAVALAIVAFSCWTAWVIIPCSGSEWWRTLLDVLFVWVGFTIGSESVYQRIPKPEAVVEAVLKANAARADKLEMS